ncbi:MAG: pre-peptidase C-terminal domain-containing protein, partial [Bacteroidota bacterium]|nr:pre-peptidase C-terminal domain-containing protein [Bacteroidota bacterium]
MRMKILLRKSWLIAISFLLFGFVNQLSAQCEMTYSYGSATVGAPGVVTTISTCNYTSEYSTVSGIVSGSTYEFTCTLSGVHKYVTLRDAASGGTVLAHGSSPLTYTSTITGTIYPHWSDDAACNTSSGCHVTTVELGFPTLACGNTNAGTLVPSLTSQKAGYASGDTYFWVFDYNDTWVYSFSSCTAGEDTYIRIYDASGTQIAYNDDNGPLCSGTAASLEWTAVGSGTAFVSLAHYSCNNLVNADSLEYYYTSCNPPVGAYSDFITLDCATLFWNSPGTLFDVKYNAGSDFDPATAGTSVTATDTTTIINGLSSSTTYYWYVRTDCSGSVSTWAGPYTFTTQCATFTAPFSETFDGSSIPACWSQSATSGGPWVFSGTPGYSAASAGDHTGNGGYFTWMDFSGTDAGVILTSPTIDVSSLTSAWLSFYLYSHNGNGTDINILYVEAWNGTSWIQVDSIQEDNGGWTEYSYDLATFTYGTNLVQFQFRAESGGGSGDYYNDFLIDDVSIFDNSSAPLCGSIVAPADSTDGLPSDVDLFWNASSATTGYYLSVGTDNPPTNLMNAVDVGNVLTYSLLALNYNTDYYWQVTPYNANGAATGCDVNIFTIGDMPSANSCDYTVELYDSYGDGWNGGALTIYVGGTAVLTNITINTGSGPEIFTFSVPDGANMTATYSSGSYDSEVTYFIYDSESTLFFSDGPYPSASVTPGIASCPTCSYSVELFDSYGDGWNGGALTVFVDGTEVLSSVTIATGSGPEIFYFDTYTGGEITTAYSSGSYDSEVTYYMYDPNGTLVFNDGPYPSATGNAGFANCDAALPGTMCDVAFDYGFINDPAITATLLADETVWYMFELDADYNNVYVSLCGSTIDTKLELWDDCSATAYLAYNDDFCGTQSEIEMSFLSAGIYYAKVFASAGATGDYTLEVTAPVCADLQLPLDASTDELVNLDVIWDAAYGATGYLLNVGTDNPPTNLYSGLDVGNVLTYSLSALAYNSTYYWEIMPYYPNDTVSGCGVFSFSTMGAPGCATLISPADLASPIGVDGSLTWNSSFGADGYYLNIGTDYPPTNLYYNLDLGDVNIYEFLGLNYSSTYYWQILPYNGGGTATACDTFQFTTMDQPSGASCDYTVELFDSYGDGWNGGLLTISVGGVPVLVDITVASGSGPEIFTFSVFDGGEVTVSYTAGGWAYENSYYIYDSEGNLFYSDGVSGQPGAGGSAGFAVCPSCDYSIDLFDSYGDGWNGGMLDVLVDGIVVLDDITIASGSGPVTFTFNLYHGSAITTVYTAGGWAYENSYIIYDANGTQVFADGTSGQPAATGDAGLANCLAPAPGSMCSAAFDYGFVNDPSITGSHAADAETWYMFTLDTEYANVNVSLCGSTFDTELELWDDCSATSYLAYNDDFCGTQSEIEESYLTAGVYYAKIFASAGVYGDYTIEITADAALWGCMDPTAVNYDNTATLDDGGCYYMGDSCSLAIDYGYINDPSVTSATIAAYDVEWYSFTLDGDYEMVSASLCNTSDFDTRLDIYDACDGNLVGTNDDFCGVQSQIDFTFLSAGTYYAKVYGYGSAYGNFNLNITGTLILYGCMDINATNYDATATWDDGTCVYPPYNSGVTDIMSPTSGAFMYAPQTVTIDIMNYGANDISGFDVAFVVDAGTPVIETFTDTIPAFGSMSYTFTGQADVSGTGLHTIEAYTMLVNDWDPLNDSYSVTIDNFTGCYWTVKLVDSYGDGWNGGWLEININGAVLYADLTLVSGSSGTFDIPVYDGDLIDIHYNPGQFSTENSYVLYDAFGNQVFIDGVSGTPSSSVYSTSATCVNVIYGCTDPTALNYDANATVDDGTCEYIGETCLTAIDYGFINDPAMNGVLTADKSMWYSFTLTEDYVNVEVSLCGSSINTILEVVDMCNGTQLGFNDDYCGDQSQVDFATLATGVYYARVYAGVGVTGDYTIEITGTAVSQTGPQLPWTFELTGTNHTILIPQTAAIDVNGTPAQVGDILGVFFNDNGVMVCGGYIEYSGITTSLAAWGDDNQTSYKDGFATGETFMWKIWQAATGDIFDAVATYIPSPGMPNEDTYSANGMSGITSLNGTVVDYQQIMIPLGWSIISTYINPFDATLETVFAGIVGNVEIVKDDLGMVYWPSQGGLNTIGSLVIGEGYHINTNVASLLELAGAAIVPELTPLSMALGWNTFAYLRNSEASVVTMVSTIAADIELLKNGFGNVYWPQYGVDMIGNMVPGEGYQMKLFSATILTYPANGTVAPSK